MNKKASMMTELIVVIAIVALLGVLVSFVFTKFLDNGVNIASMTQSNTAIQSCSATWQRENNDKTVSDFDLDKDGIVDACDVCVPYNIKKEEFVKVKFNDKAQEWLTDRIDKEVEDITYEDFLKLFRNHASGDLNDNDGDGIIDGCDSNNEEPVKVWFGDVDRVVEKECDKVEKIFGSELHSKPKDSRAKYTICRITS